MATVKLRVSGMRGPDCAARIAAALRAERAFFGAVVSHASGCVEVDFEDDEVSVDHLVRRIAEAGYLATLSG
jgi:copper chaperone CopZ